MINKNYPRVAILLAAFNGMDWIREQLDSILNQIDVDLTIFISVDISSDNSYEYCLRLSQSDARVVILKYGESFGGAGKNFYRLFRDVDFSSFDYVSLADQDDIWLEGKLSHAISVMREKSVNGYSSNVLAFWEDGRSQIIVKSQSQKKYDFLFEGGGPGCTFVLTKSSVEKFKYFLINNPSVNDFKLHDWFIYAFYRVNDLGWVIDDFPNMRYRQHANNQVGFNKGYKAYMVRFLQVRGSLFRGEVNKLIILLGSPKEFKFERIFLIKNFNELRRRRRDAYILLIFNIFCIF